MFIQELDTIQSAGNKKEKSVQFSPKSVRFQQWLELDMWMNSACDICLNLPSVKISENSCVAFSELRAMWVGSRFLQSDPVLVHPNGYLTEHLQGATMLDMAWADLMFCEQEKWIFGKTQTGHLGLEWIRIFCVCLLGVTASESCCSLKNSWSMNMGWMPLVYMLTHNG